MDHSFLKARKRVVQDKWGQAWAVTQPLVHRTPAPQRGWGVTVDFKNLPTVVKGASALEVAREVLRLVKLNEVEVTPEDVWLTLNFLWISRSHESRQYISLQELSTAIDHKKSGRTERQVAVSDWLPQALSLLGYYLGLENYRSEQFQELYMLFYPQTSCR